MEVLNNFSTMMNNKLDGPIRSHLRNVYASIASASLLAAGGAFCHMNGIWEGGMLSGLGSFVLVLMLAFSRQPDGKEDGKRFLYLNGLAFCTGLSTGPLIESVWDLNPAIVVSALLYTCVIFTCFTLSALIAPEGKYLALGGPLMSILSTLLLTSIMNIFIRSYSIAYLQILIGLALMSMFILYDTHLIMEKFRLGDRDYIWHALTLFLDLASIFKHILVLLAEKEQSGNRQKKRR